MEKEQNWTVEGSEQSTAIWVEDGQGKRVCTVRNCEKDADRARLIAAAPELLTALRDLLEQITSLNGYELTRDVETYKAEAVWDDAQNRARAALAKAGA